MGLFDSHSIIDKHEMLKKKNKLGRYKILFYNNSAKYFRLSSAALFGNIISYSVT